MSTYLGLTAQCVTEIAAKFQAGLRNPTLASQIVVRNVERKEVPASTAEDAPHFNEVHRTLKMENHT